MSEEERRNLTKEMYLEMQRFFKDEFEEIKDWMKENFVCSKHCQKREANIDKQFIYVFVGLAIIGAIAGVDNLIPWIRGMVGI